MNPLDLLFAVFMNRPLTGISMYYYEGNMKTVAINRQMKMEPWVAGYSAVADCSMVGHHALVSLNGRPWVNTQVLDCQHPRDRARYAKIGLVVEVSYNLAAPDPRFLKSGRTPAKVIYKP